MNHEASVADLSQIVTLNAFLRMLIAEANDRVTERLKPFGRLLRRGDELDSLWDLRALPRHRRSG